MLAGVLYACGDKNSFEIKGTIDGAANKKMVVQRTDNGVWVNIDSIETDGDGKFAYHGAAPAFPEIYHFPQKDNSKSKNQCRHDHLEHICLHHR